jgi:signal transduction histidine kinase
VSTEPITVDTLFAAVARASCGLSGVRIDVPPEADLEEPLARLAMALNILFGDLEFRHEEAQRHMRELLEERSQRLLEAEEGVRRREEFISIAAHELYTPLTSLQLVVEGLRTGLISKTPAQTQRAIDLAERQTRRLSLLVDTLLSIGRIQSGVPLLLQPQEIDLVAVVRDVAASFKADLERSGSRLTIDAPAPAVGRWDRQRVEQAVSNLLSNAIKFGAGKPIEVTVATRDEAAQLVVRDHGVGVAPERLPQIFGRFERGVSSSEYGGLGLGLFIVQEIVRAHGGSVRAERAPGEGASFTVELPCAGPSATSSDAPRREKEP